MKKQTIWQTLFFSLCLLTACSTNKVASSSPVIYQQKDTDKKEKYRTTASHTIDLEEASSGSISWMELLQQTPGLTVKGSGRDLSIQIRAKKSMTASFQPLFVVNGIIMGNGFSNISQIDPTMVKRVEVLKDAASGAAYGSRGADGVIEVTLK